MVAALIFTPLLPNLQTIDDAAVCTRSSANSGAGAWGDGKGCIVPALQTGKLRPSKGAKGAGERLR